MHTPPADLTRDERYEAYILLRRIVKNSTDNQFTQIDCFQLARLQFTLGQLATLLDDNVENHVNYFKSALNCLKKGGINLSLNKWVELVSLRKVK